MSEAEKLKKIRDELVNSYQERLEQRIEFTKVSLRELKEFVGKVAKRDALFQRKLEDLDSKISEITFTNNSQVTAELGEEPLEWLESHLEALEDDLDHVPSLREDADSAYEDEKKDEEEGDEEDEDDDGGEEE